VVGTKLAQRAGVKPGYHWPSSS